MIKTIFVNFFHRW